ncbi:ARM repeat-containing protein [Aulographum hederae CBS 113979]|uniref:non-specific serine/threonine protein kinase n=1 Tax=Aulographum hederae CBS 113979 TaxID=1176131 RepID=A0A6G1H813_9PEZI|nr:ARM repeat-containing protein [Aulographum hederae CBS 113979]
MGQGYSATTLSAGSAGIDVPELADLTYEKSLSNARFMKSIRARHKDGLVVAKVVMKPFPTLKFDSYVKRLINERKLLSEIPNALPWHRILETSSNGYLVRQYIHSSLYDRMSTRPFLEDIEKKWLAFQLLYVVRDCHDKNVFHGDIKSENILVTSWNWLYLCDFCSSYKPAYVPGDNPAEFLFFFDTSGRRICNLAPERFLKAGESADDKGEVNWAMDIFGVGCVIAELFLETPTFTLSQLFKYKNGEYDVRDTHLSRIEDEGLREMIASMLSLKPEERLSADDYLNFYQDKVFPKYFYDFLHQYMYLITDPTSGRAQITTTKENLGESDERIERVYYDFDKISYFLGHQNTLKQSSPNLFTGRPWKQMFPLCIDIPNNRHEAAIVPHGKSDDGTLIFLSLIVSSVRNTARASSRLHGCELLLAFAERLTDEAKLDRVLPYFMSMLSDPADNVKVASLRGITQLLELVTVVSPINAHVFPEYILPRLQHFAYPVGVGSNPLVRATYASCLASLATSASRFMDMMQALRADGTLPTNDPETEDGAISQSVYQTQYDNAREDLMNFFEGQTKALLTDGDVSVRRAFLGSVSILCVFFGSARSNDVVLSHLNTYLNDKDWMLKCTFFETIVGVATFLGGSSLEEFILPLMVQALSDPEEFVVEKVIRSLCAIAQLGLFERSKTWELVDVVSRFTMHPNIWIREAATQFISSATIYLSVADCHSIIIPLIKIYFSVLPSNLSELKLLGILKKPLSRLVLEKAMNWAITAKDGLFWKAQQSPYNSDAFHTISSRDIDQKMLSRLPKKEEDEQWLQQLRNAGMSTDDEIKLMALKAYIWRSAHRRQQSSPDAEMPPTQVGGLVKLKDEGINSQIVFFEPTKPILMDRRLYDDNIERPGHTIAEALLDASTAVDDALARRKRSHINSHNQRVTRDDATSPRVTSPLAIPSTRAPNAPNSPPPENEPGLSVRGLSPKYSSANQSGPPSSVGSDTTVRTENGHQLRHRNSAISLMNRTGSDNKAIAEISTTSTNAFGKVDGTSNDGGKRQLSSPLALAKEQRRQNPDEIKYQAAHSYQGNDPTILKLLDSLYLENYPADFVEFGPLVQPISRRQPIKGGNGQSTGSWRPDGALVALLGEHSAAINRVVVSPDHLFFITGSDDGSVKVWDSSRMERNIAHRSRQTHKHNGDARVTSLAFVENTHCFVSTASDGSVNVVKVDVSETSGTPRYGKLKVLREYQLEHGQHAVWCEHFKTESQSILLVATNKSKIIALELRTMAILYEVENPLPHGTPTCFCVDRRHQWLLVGTSHGVMDLWDMRFRLRLKAWGFPGGSPIHRMCTNLVRGSRKGRVSIAGGTGQGEITVWDLEKASCKEAYRISGTKENMKGYTLIDIDEQKSGGMLGRFAGTVEPNGSNAVDRGIRALVTGVHALEDGSDPRHFFFISAGPDWKVRYWDYNRYETSTIVSGSSNQDGRPTYQLTQPSSELIVVSEKLHPPAEGSSKGGKGSREASQSIASGRRKDSKQSRNTVISVQQQQLLKSHLDTIMDVALLEFPYGMVVSVDRSGVIYVFS